MILVALPLFCLTMPACKSVESQASPQAPAKEAKSTAKPSAKTETKSTNTSPDTSAAQDFASRPFKINYVKAPAAVGKPSKTTIELTPLAGYKMNVDFPTMMMIPPQNGAKGPAGPISPAKEAVTEAKITLAVDITPSKKRAIPIKATADFSVCNESTCKLFRKEQIAWQLDVN